MQYYYYAIWYENEKRRERNNVTKIYEYQGVTTFKTILNTFEFIHLDRRYEMISLDFVPLPQSKMDRVIRSIRRVEKLPPLVCGPAMHTGLLAT